MSIVYMCYEVNSEALIAQFGSSLIFIVKITIPTTHYVNYKKVRQAMPLQSIGGCSSPCREHRAHRL